MTSGVAYDVPSVLTTIIARGADGFGIVVLHGAEAIAFLSPDLAEDAGKQLIKLAGVARNPGKCPELPA